MIGKVVKSLLDDSAALLVLVPVTNMYPYVINENTVMPAIIYTIDSFNVNYTKDGWAGDECAFSVVSISRDYANLQAIVTEVRNALEMERGTIEGITIQHIHMTGLAETYDNTADLYANRLSFNVYITGY